MIIDLAVLQNAMNSIKPTGNPITDFAIERQKGSLLKKYCGSGGVSEEASRQAIDKFLSSNSKCKEVVIDEASTLVRDVRAQLALWLQGFDFIDSYLQYADVGNGANRLSQSADLWGKFSTMSSTKKSLVELSALLFTKEQAKSVPGLSPGTCFALVKGSRVTVVPKTLTIGRLVCTEPTANMLAQKAIDGFIRHVLKTRVGIDMSRQPELNKLAAWCGSVGRIYATIDLESASDSISLALCRAVLPHTFQLFLEKVRSEKTELPNGELVDLHMISTQGNGFNSSLQTIIFAAIVNAVCCRAPTRSRAPTMVFGDDIIVDKLNYDGVTRALHTLGFTVNLAKSFSQGNFRESCGGDYLCGIDVRPISIKSLETRADVYTAINLLRSWARYHGVEIFRVLRVLRGSIGKHREVVPYGVPSYRGIYGLRRQCKEVVRSDEFGDSYCLAYVGLEPRVSKGDKITSASTLLLACIGTGRMVNDPNTLKPLTTEKRPRVRWVRRVFHTSVWESPGRG